MSSWNWDCSAMVRILPSQETSPAKLSDPKSMNSAISLLSLSRANPARKSKSLALPVNEASPKPLFKDIWLISKPFSARAISKANSTGSSNCTVFCSTEPCRFFKVALPVSLSPSSLRLRLYLAAKSPPVMFRPDRRRTVAGN